MRWLIGWLHYIVHNILCTNAINLAINFNSIQLKLNQNANHSEDVIA